MSSILKENSHLIQSWRKSATPWILIVAMAGPACSTGELVISTTPPQADIRARTGSKIKFRVYRKVAIENLG